MHTLTNFKNTSFEPGKYRPMRIHGVALPIRSVIRNVDLGHDDVRIEFEDDEYSLPPLLSDIKSDLVEHHRTDRMFNGDLTRINDLRYDFFKRQLVVNTRQTTYFDSLASNFSLDLVVGNKSIRQTYAPPNLPLYRSQLSNHMSVSGILITKDRKMVFQERSDEGKDDRRQLSCGIAGLMKYRDSHLKNGQPDVFQSLIAQGQEELGITLDMKNIKLIAISKDLRSYIIQFIFIVNSNIHSSQIKGGPDEWEYSALKVLPVTEANISRLMSHNLTYNLRISLSYYQDMLKRSVDKK